MAIHLIRSALAAALLATAGCYQDDTAPVAPQSSLAPVASVTVVPGNVSAAVNDTLGFRADLRDDTGNLLADRPVSWFSADTAVITLSPSGATALVRARAAGNAILRATSEGKTGQATITVR